MSAYGDIKRVRDGTSLPSTFWLPEHSREENVKPDQCITIHHLTLETARALPGLLEYLGAVFAKEIEDGLTYPQEGEMVQNTFEAYFFAADVFVGIVGHSSPRTATASIDNAIGAPTISDISSSGNNQPPSRYDISTERGERTWQDSVAGYYYVSKHTRTLRTLQVTEFLTSWYSQIKPNYPGRSSHVRRHAFYASISTQPRLGECRWLFHVTAQAPSFLTMLLIRPLHL